eukprot:TRINITY_DN21413_c0_g1_i1.p1 TRINITY_DN21413_c0_g1~~TRINITY_DN21413_c0_g1_i1.p1  ORF type:complete len:1004 (+),score=361.98 TRINITY_DN21413_c0_g1_i1:52-3063(+)
MAQPLLAAAAAAAALCPAPDEFSRVRTEVSHSPRVPRQRTRLVRRRDGDWKLGVNYHEQTLVVSFVLPGGPADWAGVAVGERVVEVDGHRVTSTDLQSRLKSAPSDVVLTTVVQPQLDGGWVAGGLQLRVRYAAAHASVADAFPRVRWAAGGEVGSAELSPASPGGCPTAGDNAEAPAGVWDWCGVSGEWDVWLRWEGERLRVLLREDEREAASGVAVREAVSIPLSLAVHADTGALEVDDEDFDDILEEYPALLLSFYVGQGCVVCPIMEQQVKTARAVLLERGYAVSWVRVHAAEKTAIALRAGVHTVPLLQFYLNGVRRQLHVAVGWKPAEIASAVGALLDGSVRDVETAEPAVSGPAVLGYFGAGQAAAEAVFREVAAEVPTAFRRVPDFAAVSALDVQLPPVPPSLRQCRMRTLENYGEGRLEFRLERGAVLGSADGDPAEVVTAVSALSAHRLLVAETAGDGVAGVLLPGPETARCLSALRLFARAAGIPCGIQRTLPVADVVGAAADSVVVAVRADAAGQTAELFPGDGLSRSWLAEWAAAVTQPAVVRHAPAFASSAEESGDTVALLFVPTMQPAAGTATAAALSAFHGAALEAKRDAAAGTSAAAARVPAHFAVVVAEDAADPWGTAVARHHSVGGGDLPCVVLRDGSSLYLRLAEWEAADRLSDVPLREVRRQAERWRIPDAEVDAIEAGNATATSMKDGYLRWARSNAPTGAAPVWAASPSAAEADVRSVLAFHDAALAGRVERLPFSEPVPRESAEPVRKLVGRTHAAATASVGRDGLFVAYGPGTVGEVRAASLLMHAAAERWPGAVAVLDTASNEGLPDADEEPASLLLVTRRPGIGGVYTLTQHRHRGMPVWMVVGGGGVLFAEGTGAWMVGPLDGMAADQGWMVSDAHGGRLPHAVRGWSYWAEDRWASEPWARVTPVAPEVYHYRPEGTVARCKVDFGRAARRKPSLGAAGLGRSRACGVARVRSEAMQALVECAQRDLSGAKGLQ